MYINSPGGSVTSGLAIYDTMQYIANPIHTLCVGQACSMASILLSAGTPGQRRALPNARVMIHQPSGGAQGQATDIAIRAQENPLPAREAQPDLREAHAPGEPRKRSGPTRLSRPDAPLLPFSFILHSWQPLHVIEESVERDHFMSAEQAKEFGILDEVIAKRPDVEEE